MDSQEIKKRDDSFIRETAHKIVDEAEKRGHKNATVGGGAGGLFGGLIGSFLRGPLGTAVGAALGGVVGHLVGQSKDDSGKKS